MFFVKPEEVGIISESRRKARLGNRVAAADEVVDEVDSAQGEIIVHRDADLIAEKVANVVFAQVMTRVSWNSVILIWGGLAMIGVIGTLFVKTKKAA